MLLKEYRTTAILGCSTDSYDSDGKVVRYAPFSHITREQIEAALDKFRGEIHQVPPMFVSLLFQSKELIEK
jgi:tRNA pseudouridine55 synthase